MISSDFSEKKHRFNFNLCVQSLRPNLCPNRKKGMQTSRGETAKMGIKGIWHSLDPHDLQCMYILLEILFLRIQYTYTVHIRVDTSFLYHKNNLKYINLTSSNHLNMTGWW